MSTDDGTQLAMATLGTTGAIAYLGLSGGGKADKSTPPIKAASGDEEKFIRYVSPWGWEEGGS